MNHTNKNIEMVALGAGCFWCVEAAFMNINGIEKVKSGYTGGHTTNPTYKDVCEGTTGHAEVVLIEFDNSIISFDKILEIYFTVHDPTQLNRQGNDIGTQYRSEIFCTTPQQIDIALGTIHALEAARIYNQPIVTKVSTLEEFYPAENYHDNYFNLNPQNSYCQLVVKPKVEKIKTIFENLLKNKFQ